MRRRHHCQQALLALVGQRLLVAGEERLERLLAFPFRMLRRHRLDAVEREGGLEIDRLLAPQRAVIVEHRDALSGRHEVRAPCVVTFATNPVMDFLTAPSFHEGKGSV